MISDEDEMFLGDKEFIRQEICMVQSLKKGLKTICLSTTSKYYSERVNNPRKRSLVTGPSTAAFFV